MNPIAAKYGAPPLPQVNLIPKDINDKRNMRVVQTFAVIAVVAAIGFIGVLTAFAMIAKNVAQDRLDNALADEDAAVQSRDELKPVYDAYLVQEKGELTLTQIGWAEMDNSALYTALAAQDNDQVAIKEVTFSLPSPEGSAGASDEDLWNGGIGTINITAFARDRQSALDYSDRVEAIPGIARVVVRMQKFEMEGPQPYYKVGIQAQVMPNYLTNRLIPSAGLIGSDLLQQAVEAAQVNPSAAPVAPPVEIPPSATASPVKEG